MTKTIRNEQLREAVRKGVLAVYDPVRITMGPEGKNALIPRTYNRGVRITNDGHAVAQVQDPQDEFVKAVVEVMKDAESKTNNKAGDGTTGTIVIAGKLYLDVEQRLGNSIGSRQSSSNGVMSLRKEILSEAEKVKEQIKASSKKVETRDELEHIATVSVEDPDLGKQIAGMAWELGPDGSIDVTEGYKGEIEIDQDSKGYKFPAKVPRKAFVNRPERYEMVAQDCPVLITNYKLDNTAQLQFTRNLNTAKLIIVAPEFSDNVLVGLAQAIKNGFHVFPVHAPALRTDNFEDLAVYCGAKFINKEKGLKLTSITDGDLGFLEKLIVKDSEAREEATAIGGAGLRTIMVADTEDGKRKGVKETTAIEQHIQILKSQLQEQKTEAFKKMMEKRIASMYAGVGVIRVGAPSDTELYYKKLKIEDAVYACRAALRHGYVRGGGLCLKEISDQLPDGHVLKEALNAPYNQIRENAEQELEIGDDIIDPTDAIYYAVENATSVVAHLITLGSITVEIRPKEMGEGLEAIANQLNFYNRLWNKKEAIYRENQLEMDGDRIRLQEQLEATDQ